MSYCIIIIIRAKCKNINYPFFFNTSIDFFSSATNEISAPIAIRKSFLRPKSTHVKYEI